MPNIAAANTAAEASHHQRGHLREQEVHDFRAGRSEQDPSAAAFA